MSLYFQSTTIALAIFTSALTLSVKQASANCEITQCRGGGKVSKCWSQMQREAQSKRKSCNQLIIGSGVSSYAMALSLPRACIKPSAVIQIHRPYFNGYRAVAIGSSWHNFYFGRIKAPAVNYFRQRGGMQRDGFDNAAYLIKVPASKTGLPLCSRS